MSKEIETKIKDLREKIRVARFSMAGSRAKNVKEQKAMRREIARLETQKSEARHQSAN